MSVRSLIQSWRVKANDLVDEIGNNRSGESGVIATLDWCADELQREWEQSSARASQAIIELRLAAQTFPTTSRDVQLAIKGEVLRLAEAIDTEITALRADDRIVGEKVLIEIEVVRVHPHAHDLVQVQTPFGLQWVRVEEIVKAQEATQRLPSIEHRATSDEMSALDKAAYLYDSRASGNNRQYATARTELAALNTAISQACEIMRMPRTNSESVSEMYKRMELWLATYPAPTEESETT